MPNETFIKDLDGIEYMQKDKIKVSGDENVLENRFQFIYVHIPKNAGTSIRKKIKNIYDFVIVDAHDIKNQQYPRKIISIGHVPFSHYSEQEKLISFVRNPVSRCISMFYYHKLHQKFSDINVFINHIYNDKQIVNFIRNKTHPTINSYLLKSKRNTNVSFSWKCQTYWISSDIYFIGKIETLEEDLKKLCDKLNCTYVYNKINFNINSNKPQGKIYISEETKQKIYEIYKEDFDNFNYSI
jgi:hypothetical protein